MNRQNTKPSDRPSRRSVLAGAAGLSASLALPGSATAGHERYRQARDTIIVRHRIIEVNGKAAKVFGVTQRNGQPGLTISERDAFDVELRSHIDEEFIMHWHGQEPPGPLDGNPYYFYLQPGSHSEWFYKPRAGTHWMHSHFSLQEQQLLAAPLIVHTDEDMRADRQEVVVMLHDFTFRDPEEILAELKKGEPMGAMSEGPDLNDVEYDAFLANDRTLDDPEVVPLDPNAHVRLRIINAAAGTNFFIDLGALTGTVIAVDGNPVQPVSGSRFPMAIAQRLDILIDLPKGALGPWPITAQREGDTPRTGIILARPGDSIKKLSVDAETKAGVVGDDPFELGLKSVGQLVDRPVDRKVTVKLTGNMAKYVWGMEADIGDTKQFPIKFGERVEMTIANTTPMAHPMHLHGHHFKVLQIGDKAVDGAFRDTMMVPAKTAVRVQFDAASAGHWPFHCHILYHAYAGMIMDMKYDIK